MLKWMQMTFFGAVLLVGVALAMVWTLRAVAPDVSGRHALAVMEVPPRAAPPGENGATWLMFNNLRVPEREVEVAVATELDAFRIWHHGMGARFVALADSNEHESPTFASPAARRYPQRDPMRTSDALCSYAGLDCLAKVKTDSERARRILAAESERLALADRSLAAAHVTNLFPESMDTPLPAYQLWQLSITATAMRSVDGDGPGALARTCDQLTAVRQFARQARGLVDKMVASAATRGVAGLLLSLRKEHPEVALPESCAAATSPVDNADYYVCDSMRGEYRMMASLSRQQSEEMARRGDLRSVLLRVFLLDDGLQRMWMAESLAGDCTPEYLLSVDQGTAPDSPRKGITTTEARCYAAFLSCALAKIAQPAYRDYQVRLLDDAAKLRLLLAAQRLAGGEIDLETALAEAASPGYSPPLHDASTKTMSITPREDKPDHGSFTVSL